MEANEAMKAMAKRIAKATTKNRNIQRDNGLVYGAALEAALAAIMETQARENGLREALVDARACLVDHLKYMKEPASARIIKRIDAALAGDRHG